jgi:flagellar biosynthesis GTPase FlhF
MDIIHYYGQTRKEAVEKAISEYGKDIYILNEAPKNLANGFVGVSIIPNEDTLDDAYQEIDKTNTTDSKSSLSTLRKLALNYEFEYSNRQKRPNRRSKSDIEQASSNFQFAETGDEQINEQNIIGRLEAIENALKRLNHSKNLDFYNHPIFLQLLKAGITVNNVSEWFLRIMNTGIDPFENPKKFNEQISNYIAHIVGRDSAEFIESRSIYFGGTTSNKRALISDLIETIKIKSSTSTIGVIILDPDQNYQRGMELEFYCDKYSIQSAIINTFEVFQESLQSWRHFDYILIDTPDIYAHNENTVLTCDTIQNWLIKLNDVIENIWVQNAAICNDDQSRVEWINEYIRATQIVFSHFDQIDRLGSLLSFLSGLNANCKLLHIDNVSNEKIKLFEPKWFIGKLLGQL